MFVRIGMRIRSAERGNGPVRCPYHSWTYDAYGVPFVIPGNDQAFRLDKAECAKLALHRWGLELCGAFIFIRRLPVGLSLKNDLGGCSTSWRTCRKTWAR
jgi:choline monooxygenase